MSRCSFSPTATFHTTAHTKSQLVTEMTSSSHPSFRLLIGWFCLTSSALLIMTVYLTAKANLLKTSITAGDKEQNSTENNGQTQQQIDFWRGPSFNDYICLIRDNEKTWICSTPCETGSFSLENGTVKVTVSGLYYFHAQVHFIQITQTNDMPTVTLLKNKGPGTKERKLSQVKRIGPGSLTMIRLVKLNEGDSISLKINPIIGLSGEDYDTYWEIILFNNK